MFIAYGVVTLLIAAAITLLIVIFGQRSTPTPTQTTPVNLNGSLACLPHQNSLATLECAIGLKTDDGRYYKLKGLPETNTDFNSRIRITGQLSQPQADEVYDIVGSIQISSIETLISQ